MSVVVNELTGTRTMQRFALTTPRARRTFMVFENEPSDTNQLTGMKAYAHPDVPKVGDKHPEDGRMRAATFDIQAVEESDYAQTIIINYAVSGVGGSTFTMRSTSVKGKYEDFWRLGAEGLSPTFVGRSSNDIGGTRIDVSGYAVSIPIFQQMLDVRSPYYNEPNFDVIRVLTNKRNQSPFEGFPTGSLLFLGAQSTVDNNNVWQTTYKFAADELYHARQVARRDTDGKVGTNDLNDTLGPQATNVYWVQMHGLENFGELTGYNP